jgi:8-oxo-dGTP pyrophosphatase MutT (NUDIX family)
MSRRAQAGVIPFRRKKGAIEICLIRNRGRKKWKIPKGFVDPGESVEQAALKEAWEEAGLTGKLVGAPMKDKWEESRFRERAWSPADSAFAMLKKHPVRSLLDAAATRIERRSRPR